MLKKTLVSVALVLSAAFAGHGAVWAANAPTMHEVYLAAEGGRFIEAQAMMDKVLQEHPNSAKAHFVQAELFAKQGMLSKAGGELSRAETLEPGLPFAKPQAVQNLRGLIASTRQAAPAARNNAPSYSAAQAAPATQERGLPWGMLLLGGLGLVAFVMVVSRFMNRRAAANNNGMAYAANGAMQPAGAGGFGGGGMGGGGMMQPQAGGGIGSGIMGGLATGAAVGAGIVAGQALMHHFTDGDKPSGAAAPSSNDNWAPAPANDMGGNDFGVADSSSWDSGSGGGDGGDGGGDW